MNILFLQFGGTIDKDYPMGATHHGYEFKIGEPAFHSILARAKPAFSWDGIVVMRKDSLDMTDADRSVACDYVEKSGVERIVGTHGTDTILETATVLSGIAGKTIVLTGAMLPEKFRDSKADCNLGMAVAAAQTLPHGVYIALYGQVKRWDEFKPR
ncbi:MAG: asparaginase [Patescibacteria group bacterium]|nr:asparaginase [Patescibacteria group bacterium]MDE2058037.1 asparaginase [Patescibacteria group bacterium]